jgi:hypothetical protein
MLSDTVDALENKLKEL